MLKGGALLFAVGLLVARDAAGAPRAKLPLASVAPFTVGRAPADEELGYFAPEVARAVVASLESAGVEVGASGEWPITGRMEALSGERVRLTATARGHFVSIDGPVEIVDQLAAQLAQRLVPILTEGEPAKRVAGVRIPPPALTTAPRSEAKREALPSAAPVAAAPPPPPPSPEAKVEPKPETKPEAKPETKIEPPKIEVKNEPREMPEVMPAYPQQPSNYHPYGFVSGRVVAHSIPDPPASYVGTGISATQALYSFLGRRLRLAVVPTGVGITSPAVAVDEGWRAAARSVVMARVDNIEYLPQGEGVSVRLRVQVVVVKEGRIVLRRVVDSPASDPTRRTDPVYQAVSGALEPLASDLASAIGGS